MTRASTIRLLLFFAVAFSLSALPGPLSSNFSLPYVHATTLTTPEKWYPTGPQFDYWRPVIFLSESTEFTNLQSPTPQIDITDWPLTPPVISSVCGQTAFFCTAKQNDTGYFEIEFNQAANFWGASANYGNALAGGANPGLDFRQGIAHLIEKDVFVVSPATGINGVSCAIDNPEPCSSSYLGHAYTTPNPCGWDTLFPEVNPTRCVVGATGGTAYNCRIGTVAPKACPTGTGTPGAVNFPWQPAIPSTDFCAAAAHFKHAFDVLAPGKVTIRATDCVLQINGAVDPTGTVWNSAAGIPGWIAPNLFARLDDIPRLALGQSVAQEICALFTGTLSFTSGGCSQNAATATILSETEGTITSFPGFTTDPSKLQVTWHIYTAGFGAVFPMDSSFFSGYYSQFVDSFCSTYPNCPRGAGGAPNPLQTLAQANGGPCKNAATPSAGPADYQFICNAAFDGAASAMEFSPCVGNPTGDVDTQVGAANATLVNCTTAPTARTGISAAYVASDIYGRNILTLPIFAKQNIFGYLGPQTDGTGNWARVVNHADSGLEAGYAAFNAYSANPASSHESTPTQTVRQGFKQTTRSLNPYISTTVWDFFIIGFRNAGTGIYDTLFQENPANPGQSIEWMVNNPSGPTIINCTSSLGGNSTFNPCPGASNPASNFIPPATTNVIRMALRSDIFWQDANLHPSSGFVSAYDVKFTYTTMLANGAFQSTSLAPMQCTVANCVDGIQVTTPREFEIRVNSLGVFTLAGFGAVTILPGSLWSTCGGNTHTTPNFVNSWDASVAGSGVPDSCMVLDGTKAGPGFDPLKAGILIGSGGWQCTNANGFTPPGTVPGTVLPWFTSPPAIGTGCAHDASGAAFNSQNPPVGGTYIVQRFGYGTGAPGFAPPNRIYFRAESKTAQWIWSGNTGDPLHDSSNKGIVQRCQNASLASFDGIPDPTLGFPNGCAHWQQGIGAPGGHSLVGSFQIGTVQLLFQYKWTPTTNGAGSDWTSTYSTPPDGIAAFPPVLYEGSFVQAGVTYANTLSPATIASSHCTSAYNATTPVAGYDC